MKDTKESRRFPFVDKFDGHFKLKRGLIRSVGYSIAKADRIYDSDHPGTFKVYKGVSASLGCGSGNPGCLISAREKADLDDGYTSQDGSEKDKPARKDGDWVIRRRTPEGFLPFLCGLFLVGFCGTFVLLWALGWLPDSKPRHTNDDP